ncbi:hypothetical protein AB1Y20_008628 [Prymnesium parvum]|uniref:Uncharacterized protein n=1 Tax=Prymnesium parvum TaxID=97485 RepID=A0AB34ITS1_PRYPA
MSRRRHQSIGPFGPCHRCCRCCGLIRPAMPTSFAIRGTGCASRGWLRLSLQLRSQTLLLRRTQSLQSLRLPAIPIYFLLAAVLLQMDAINSILALILITIGTKIFLSAADVEVPTWLFVGALTAWRVLMGLIALRATYAVPEIPDNTEGTTTLDEASARMCSTK